MGAPIFTASATERVFACPPSAADGVELLEEQSNEAADTGTALHSLAEHTIEGIAVEPSFKPLADPRRAYRMWNRWHSTWWRENGSFEWVAELAFAISTVTGVARRLPASEHRDYSTCTPDEVAGTVDAVQVLPDMVRLRDWKSGNPNYTTPAASNGQLKLLSLMASRFFERDVVEAGLVFVSDMADPWEDIVVFDLLDLDLFEDELRSRVAMRNTAARRPGSKQCHYCPVAKCDVRRTRKKRSA